MKKFNIAFIQDIITRRHYCGIIEAASEEEARQIVLDGFYNDDPVVMSNLTADDKVIGGDMKEYTVSVGEVREVEKLTEEEFDVKYTMVKNHLDDNASLDGCMFETYGKELEFIKSQNPEHIWTYQDNDYGIPCFTSGFHVVNRIGYFVTHQAHDLKDIYVTLDTEENDADAQEGYEGKLVKGLRAAGVNLGGAKDIYVTLDTEEGDDD